MHKTQGRLKFDVQQRVAWLDKPKVSDGLWICWVYQAKLPVVPLFLCIPLYSGMQEKVIQNYAP